MLWRGVSGGGQITLSASGPAIRNDGGAEEVSEENYAPTVGIHHVDFVKQPECFDFVFLTEGLAGLLKAHGIDAVTEASDHQPVWVELA